MSIAGLKRASRSLNAFGVPIERNQSFGNETTKDIYFLSVLGDLADVLVFIKLEI